MAKKLSPIDESKNGADKNSAKKNDKYKRRRRGCGGCGCFLVGLIILIILLGAGVGVGAYFGDKFLTENYGVSLGDCFALLHNIYNVNEKKVVTDPAKESDKDEFYSSLGSATFIKGDEIGGVVDTAIDEELLPLIDDVLSSASSSGVSTARRETLAFTEPESEESGEELASTDGEFSWKDYLFDLLDEGVFDTDRIKAYFADDRTVAGKYNDYFLLSIKGKGIVSTIDYVIDSTLDNMEGMSGFKGLFGLKQLDFMADDVDENTETRTIRAVLQGKLRGAVDAFFSSPLFDKYLGDIDDVRNNKELLRPLSGLLPQNVLLTFSVKITKNKTTNAKTVDVAFDLNNLEYKNMDKWFGFAENFAHTDVRAMLSERATALYAQLEEMASGYIDIFDVFGDGKISLDVYGAGATIVNKMMGLEGSDQLTKYEAASALTDVLYANSDVNGNAIEDVMETEAPYYMGEDWQQETEDDFLAMLRHAIAFASNKTFDDLLAEFKNSSGSFELPSNYASLLSYIDQNYLKTSLAFLSDTITIDDRYVAYLFEGYKADVLSAFDFDEYADCITLNYTKISTAEKLDGTHAYVSLGVTAHVNAILEVLGFSDFSFATSVFGEDVYVCAKADVTLDPDVTRDRTTFMLNGLSAAQTSELVSVASKVAKRDVIGEFVEKYIDEFIDKFDAFKSAYFDVSFSTREEDGVQIGTIILPSITEMFQKFYDNNLKKDGKDLNVAALVSATGAILASTPDTNGFEGYISDSNTLIKGESDAYDDYDGLVKSELYEKYFITDKTVPISTIFTDIFDAMTGGGGALDAVKSYVHVKAAYFTKFGAASETSPILDGHSFAYLLSESFEPLMSIFADGNEDLADICDYINIVDVAFDDGVMSLTLAADTESLLDKFAKSALGDYYGFVKNLLAMDKNGDKKDINITLKVNISGAGDDVGVVIYELSDTNMQAIFDALSAFGIKYFDFSDPSNTLVTLAGQIKSIIDQFGELVDRDGEQVLSMTSIFKMLGSFITYDDAGTEKSLTAQEAYTLVKNIVVYDADTEVVDRTVAARAEFDAKTRSYYYITSGTDAISGIIKDGNSDDTLSFVSRSEIAATKRYGSGFIYGEENLAALLDILELNGASSSYAIKSITVDANDMIWVNAVIDTGEYVSIGAFDDIDIDMATKFLVSIPLNFGSATDNRASSMHFADESETKRIISLFALDIDAQLNSQKTQLVSALSGTLNDYSMRFVKGSTAETTGLSMPSLTTLIASARAGVSASQAEGLFDDVVCYEVEESDYGFVSDLAPIKARFVSLLKEYFFVRDTYSSTDAHNGETVTFDMIADALGFHSTQTYDMENLMDTGRVYAAALYSYYSDTLGMTDADIELAMTAMSFTPEQIASAKDDSVKANTQVVFDEEILLALFSTSSDGADINAKAVVIDQDDVVSLKGVYALDSTQLSGVSANFTALLPSAFIATIVIDTADSNNNSLSLDGPDSPSSTITTAKLCADLGAFGSALTQSDFDSYLSGAADGITAFLSNMSSGGSDARFVASYNFDGDDVAGLLVPSAVEYAQANGIIALPV